MKTQLCQTIKPNEELDYNHLTIVCETSRNFTHLAVYPFSNCHPYDRETDIKKWNEIACKIFSTVLRKDVQLESKEGDGLLTSAYSYTIECFSDNGKFKITAQIESKYFNQDLALKAIKVVMKKVIDMVNEIIESAWLHNKMIECFPEYESRIIKDLDTGLEYLKANFNALKNEIGYNSFKYSDDKTLTQRVEAMGVNLTEISGTLNAFEKSKLPKKPRKRAGK